MKRLIVFDLDGTLAESKSAIDAEMAGLLCKLLSVTSVGVISGGDWPQFQTQLLCNLPAATSQDNLYLLPTSGTKFYRFEAAWRQIYAESFTEAESMRIVEALADAVRLSGFSPERTWGEQIEDRGSQITYSALGQQAPVGEKKAWDPDFAKRRRIKEILDPMLPDISIRMGGSTSIDITRQGIDKAYGIRKLEEILQIPIADMLFIGDALFPGGNDYAAIEAGCEAIRVRDPEETKRVIETILACLSR